MGEVTACHKEYLKFRPKKEKTAAVVATFPRHIHDESIHTHTHTWRRGWLFSSSQKQQQQQQFTFVRMVGSVFWDVCCWSVSDERFKLFSFHFPALLLFSITSWFSGIVSPRRGLDPSDVTLLNDIMHVPFSVFYLFHPYIQSVRKTVLQLFHSIPLALFFYFLPSPIYL